MCDKSKLDDKGCVGAPDFIVEILSPSTSHKDQLVKFNKYQTAGVREYWIADPEIKGVQVFILKDGHYTAYMYDDTESVPVSVLEGCVINLPDVFNEE